MQIMPEKIPMPSLGAAEQAKKADNGNEPDYDMHFCTPWRTETFRS